MDHQHFLDAACTEAATSIENGGVGVGAVMVKNGAIVARSHDRTVQLNDPVAVAEVDCIRVAGRRNDQKELTLYSTRYPDMLCVGTVLQFSIGSMIIGLDEINSKELDLLKSKGVPVSFHSHDGCKELSKL